MSDITHRILNEIISHEVALRITFTGKRKQGGDSNLEVAEGKLKNTNLLLLIYGTNSYEHLTMLIYFNRILHTFGIFYILESVRKTKGGDQATSKQIDEETRNWLKNAKDRDGGRKRRQAKKCHEVRNPAEAIATASQLEQNEGIGVRIYKET